MRAAEVVELRDDRRRAWRGIVRARSAFSYRGGNSAPVVLSHDWAELRSIWRGSPNPLSGDGFVVAAVDHHGNSSVEELLPEGVAFWLRAGRPMSRLSSTIYFAVGFGAHHWHAQVGDEARPFCHS